MSLANITDTPDELAVDLEILVSFDEVRDEGEPDFVIELIDLYLHQTPLLFNSIREGLVNNDWATVKRAAHSLRGSSNNLGILQVGLVAADLEYLTPPNDIVAADLLRRLEHEFERAKGILLSERRRRNS